MKIAKRKGHKRKHKKEAVVLQKSKRQRTAELNAQFVPRRPTGRQK